jgi:hypothetical protein
VSKVGRCRLTMSKPVPPPNVSVRSACIVWVLAERPCFQRLKP